MLTQKQRTAGQRSHVVIRYHRQSEVSLSAGHVGVALGGLEQTDAVTLPRVFGLLLLAGKVGPGLRFVMLVVFRYLCEGSLQVVELGICDLVVLTRNKSTPSALLAACCE